MTNSIPNAARITLTAGLFGLAAATPALAQERVATHVPFAFIVADTELPAGNYTLTPAADGSNVVAIQSRDGRRFVFALTTASPDQPESSDATIAFDKFENHYFLSRIVAADGITRDITLTPAIMEREIARVTDRVNAND